MQQIRQYEHIKDLELSNLAVLLRNFWNQDFLCCLPAVFRVFRTAC